MSTPCLKLESSNVFIMPNFHILTNEMDYAVRVKINHQKFYIYMRKLSPLLDTAFSAG
jgi:hypothetical protein